MIDRWLHPDFLDPVKVAGMRERLLGDPARILVVDDVLAPESYELLAGGLRNDCEWETRHGTADANNLWVAAPDFDRTPEQDRMYRHDVFVRPRPGHETARGLLGLIRFKVMLQSTAFLELLGRISGRKVTGLQELLLRRMRQGDLAQPHDDAIGGRTLCMLIYFSDGWQPAFEGQFILHAAGGDRSYDPRPNRMILFDVAVKQDHSVRELTRQAGDWRRYNFSIWFL